jgi:hypothetical protein
MEENMALEGLKDLLKKAREDAALTEDQFEEELNKILPKSWIPKTKFNELTEENKMTKSQLEQTTKQLDELKKSSTLTEDQKKQLDDLKAQMEEQKKTHLSEVTNLRRNHAIETELTKAKAKNVKAARALLDDTKVVVGEDGSVSGLKEQLDAIRKDNAFLFEPVAEEQPQNTKKPSFGGSPGDTKPNGDPLTQAFTSALGL